MTFLQILVLLIGITVFPVMVGARVVGAGNKGFMSALISVLILAALSVAVPKYVSNPALAFVVSSAASAMFLAAILDTTILRGLAVSIIIVAVQFVVVATYSGALSG